MAVVARTSHAGLRPPVVRRARPGVDQACRALNVAVALVALVLLAPLFVVIAIAVRLSSPGPIIYRQPRVGIDRRGRARDGEFMDVPDPGGHLFTMYKFRTMRVSDDRTQTWASRDDARVTPVGRVLRRFRLDELPQLVNVLAGDMNVVGPRPEQPAIFGQLRETVPYYAWRQRVPPGITGLAQISLAYDQSVDDVRRKVSLDLAYIARRSVAEDARIMARTIPVMFGGRLGW